MTDQDVCLTCGHARGVHTRGACQAGAWMKEKMLRAGQVPCTCVAFVLNPDPAAVLRPVKVSNGRIVANG